MRIPENAVTRNKRRTRNQVASKWVACENIRFSSLFAAKDVSRNVLSDEEGGETDVFAGYQMSEENFRTELSRITFYDYIIYPKL